MLSRGRGIATEPFATVAAPYEECAMGAQASRAARVCSWLRSMFDCVSQSVVVGDARGGGGRPGASFSRIPNDAPQRSRSQSRNRSSVPFRLGNRGRTGWSARCLHPAFAPAPAGDFFGVGRGRGADHRDVRSRTVVFRHHVRVMQPSRSRNVRRLACRAPGGSGSFTAAPRAVYPSPVSPVRRRGFSFARGAGRRVAGSPCVAGATTPRGHPSACNTCVN
jgi:hypothetical protein